MKKILTLALMLVACIQVWAETWTDSKGTTWSFTVELDATITGSSNTEGILMIPSKVYVNNMAYDVTEIGEQAFKNQYDLTGVIIPEGVKTISKEAFAGCYNIEKLYLPYTLTTIGEDAFQSSNGLKTVYSMMQTPPQIDEYDIYNRKHATLYVPEGRESVYSEAPNWADFQTIVGLFADFDEEGTVWRFTTITDNGYDNPGNMIGLYGCDKKEGILRIPTQLKINSASQISRSIFDHAFANLSNITEVYVPNGITFIGNEAFSNCTALTTVTIPSSVTNIGDKAFDGCNNLVTVFNYVETPISITDETFSNSTNATLYVPDGKREDYWNTDGWRRFNKIIQGSVFIDNGGLIWTFSVDGDNVTITGCSKNDGVLVIPEQVVDESKGTTHTVTAIGEEAFRNYNITEVTIPGSVVTINKSAFKDCAKLTKVNGATAVKTIGDYAFYSCEVLADITIPSTLQTLGENAFFTCNALISVSLPSTLQTIGNDAFRDCQNMTSVSIAEGITAITKNMFYGCRKLQSINLPSTVTTIGAWAFYDCVKLTTIDIKDGLTSIGEHAFEGCSVLNRVIIPEGITTIEDATFKECESLTNIILPEFSLETISKYAFYGCRSLKTLTIPPTVTTINEYAFYGCVSLTGLIIPEGVKEIGNRTFSSCNSLDNIILPKGMTTIGNYAFYDCQSLESITIRDGVESIGECAFNNCPNLNKVYNYIKRPIEIAENTFSNYETAILYVLPNLIKRYQYMLDWKNFSQILDMSQTWKDANSVTWRFIDYGTYAEITGSDQTEGYLAIPETVFVEDRELPVTAITEEAFKDAAGLTMVNIPEGVEILETAAFHNCENMQTVILPSTLKDGGVAMFEGCNALTEVYNFMQEPSSIYENDFTNYSNAKLYVPKGTSDIYGEATHWKDFGTIIEMNDYVWFDSNCQYWDYSVSTGSMDATITTCNAKESNLVIPELIPCRGTKRLFNVTGIADNVFKGRTDIISMSQPESLHTIGNSTFEGCTALTDINMPENLYVIGNAAFKGCESITSVMMPENLQHVGEEAFSGCKALKNVMIAALEDKTIAAATFFGCENLAKVVIPEGIRTIGNEAFSGCIKVSDVIMPKSLTEIGEQVFDGCIAITNITIPENVSTIGQGAFDNCNNLITVNCEVENPVSITENTFSNRTNAILYVPAGSENDYAFADYWKEFKEIRPIAEKVFTDNDGTHWTYKIISFTNQELQLFADIYNIYDLPKEGAVILGCDNAEGELIIPAKVKDGNIEYNVITIDNGVFADNTALTSVDVKGAAFIGNSAFAGCTALTSVTLPEDLYWIEAEAFKGCKALTEIEIPATVIMIDQSAFYNCSQLTKATILSENLQSIGEYAFWGCINLTEVYSYMQQPVEIDGYVFTNRNNATLYVPSGCSSAYNAALYWKQFNQIVEMDPITSVTLTVGNAGKTTFTSKYDLNFKNVAGVKAYIASGFDHVTGTLTLTRVEEVQAGVGLYIIASKGDYEIPIEETDMFYVNLLKGVTKNTTLAPTTGNKTNFVLANGSYGVGFYTLEDERVMPAGKAYLQLPTAQVAQMAGPVNLEFEDEETTGIEDIETSNLDNQTSDGEWYTLDGKLLEGKPTQKGIYIVNGKKVVIK